MNKAAIIVELETSHRLFTDYISSLDDTAFSSSPAGKWNAGQQMDHIYRSIQPLAMVLRFPLWLVRLFFGKANRPSRDYDSLIARYHQKLQQGGQASGRFIPGSVHPGQKELMKKKMEHQVKSICTSVSRITESDLDEYILPHPLLGKLTVREMLYFTIYHAEHHLQLTKKNSETKINMH